LPDWFCVRLEGEISDLKLRWESDIAERSRENVARDVELNTLRDTDVKLRGELSQRKQDIDRLFLAFKRWPHLLLIVMMLVAVCDGAISVVMRWVVLSFVSNTMSHCPTLRELQVTETSGAPSAKLD